MSNQLTTEQRKLVEDNAPLAKFLARKRWEMAPSKLDYEELVSLAYQGLVDAAIRWRPYSEERDLPEEEIVEGKGFSVFSRTRIIGAILDWQKRDADHVPRSYRTDYKIVQRAGYPDHTKKYSELAEATGLTVDRIKQVIVAVERVPVSLNEVGYDDDGNAKGPIEPSSSHNVEDSVLLSTVSSAIADRVVQLPELQQVVLALRYYEGLELQAIEKELDISLTTIRDAHNAAVEAVYEAMLAAVTD